MISLDTECTGIDLRHGARPFLVTTCDEAGVIRFWEWDVDPLTREPEIGSFDLVEIQDALGKTQDVVMQNCKFDMTALAAVGWSFDSQAWSRVQDTLVAGHVLASNMRHDLTAMALQYLDEDIKPWEDRLQDACNEARRLTRNAGFVERHGAWRIAAEGLPGMPSAKSGSKKDQKGVESENPWKFDSWLPRAVCQAEGLPEPEPGCEHEWEEWDCARCGGHRWWIVCSEYANKDSETTLLLWKAMRPELERRGLTAIYRAKMASLPSVLDMEHRGVTYDRKALRSMLAEYEAEIAEAEADCLEIARSFKYRLTLPKSGVNDSLREFCFGPDLLNLPTIKVTETGRQAFDKEVVEEYKRSLPAGGKQLRFVKRLSAARKRQKSNEFLRSYETFGLPGPGDVMVLHPSANPTATATTRFSMSNPNLQQVSKQESACEECRGDGCDACGGSGEDLHSVRKVFGPAPGREWWAMDASNIELRIPAYESGEPDLIALFERPDEPPFFGSQHLLNFSVVYPELWEAELKNVGPERAGAEVKTKHKSTWYQWCKNGDFAIQYQCGEETADRSFHRPGSFRRLKEKFAKLEELNQRQVRFAERHGWVETIPDRSVDPRRGYPLLCSRGDWGRVLTTVPLNYHSQGTAGWWMVRAMTRCHEKLLEWRASGFIAWIALTVHDELVFDLPASRAVVDGVPSNLWRARELQALMERGGEDIGVPTPVSVAWCERNWAEGVSF